MLRKLLLTVLALCLLCASAGAETFTLSLIGDCTLGQQWIHRNYSASMMNKVDAWGWDWPFANAMELFQSDDLTLANCEGVLTDRKPAAGAKVMCLGTTTEHAQIFKIAGVDVCNTANNHAYDYGSAARQDTLDTLLNLGIGAFGDSETYECEVKGVKLGFVGYTYPITENKMALYKEAMDRMRADGCTFIIASAHWGKEEAYKLNQQQKTGAHYFIDNGADLVFGHGSHTVQPMEIYNGKLIFYSMSNFVFGANSTPKDKDTVVIQVKFDINADGTMSPAELYAYPYCQNYQKNFQPWPYTEESSKQRVWQKLVSKERAVKSNVPDSFLTTGYIDLKSWITDGTDTNADGAIKAEVQVTYVPSRYTTMEKHLEENGTEAFSEGVQKAEDACSVYLASLVPSEQAETVTAE